MNKKIKSAVPNSGSNKFGLMQFVYAVWFLGIAALMAFSIPELKDNPYLTYDYLKKQMNYYKYEISFSDTLQAHAQFLFEDGYDRSIKQIGRASCRERV